MLAALERRADGLGCCSAVRTLNARLLEGDGADVERSVSVIGFDTDDHRVLDRSATAHGHVCNREVELRKAVNRLVERLLSTRIDLEDNCVAHLDGDMRPQRQRITEIVANDQGEVLSSPWSDDGAVGCYDWSSKRPRHRPRNRPEPQDVVVPYSRCALGVPNAILRPGIDEDFERLVWVKGIVTPRAGWCDRVNCVTS